MYIETAGRWTVLLRPESKKETALVDGFLFEGR
mgnify:CR=1 FL=1|jgi:hypothetical protein